MPSSSNYKNLAKRLKAVKSKKAQFFIITGAVIISIFYLISKWLSPYTVIDTSAVALSDETFIYSNIKQQALKVVSDSQNCGELDERLKEYESYVEAYVFKRLLLYFDFKYDLETPCSSYVPGTPMEVMFDIELRSRKTIIKDVFNETWQSS